MLSCLISTAVGSGPLRAERRRREAGRKFFTNPELVTARRSILGPLAEGRPGPSLNKNLNGYPDHHYYPHIIVNVIFIPLILRWGEDGYIRLARGDQCGTDTKPLDGTGCVNGPGSDVR